MTAVALRPLAPGDERTFRAHYDAYIADIVAAGGSYHRDPDGTWQPDFLPYWLQPDATMFTLLIEARGAVAGFALVGTAGATWIAPGCDFCLSEFYVAPPHRRRGVGGAAARALFDGRPGRWTLAVLAGNARALRFWRGVLADYAPYSETIGEDDLSFSFVTGS